MISALLTLLIIFYFTFYTDASSVAFFMSEKKFAIKHITEGRRNVILERLFEFISQLKHTNEENANFATFKSIYEYQRNGNFGNTNSRSTNLASFFLFFFFHLSDYSQIQ